jgi:predicted Zn-dependent peptidase
MQYRHRVLYYGPDSAETLVRELQTVRSYPAAPEAPPTSDPFPELEQTGNTIFVVDYDMTQAEVIMLTRDAVYDPSEVPLISLFNEYYGGGMSSVVFQELREAKALAYSVFSVYRTPKQKEKHNYIFSYIGTQSDKLPEALGGISELMQELPLSPELFASARNGILQKISSERLTRTEVLFNHEDAVRLGHEGDIRREIFEGARKMGIDDVQRFHENHFRNRKHVMLVLGKKEELDINTLRKYGTVRELTLENIFGY